MAKRLPFSSEQYWDACRRNAYKGAWMYTYEAGTTTILKDTWTTATEEVKHPNPIQADANGIFPEVYGIGSYFIKIMNFEENDQILEADNIDGSKAVVSDGKNYVDNVTALRNFEGDPGALVEWVGYYTPGDGGGNSGIVVDPNTGIDDGGSIFDLSSGYQVRAIFNDDDIDVLKFGASSSPLSNQARFFESCDSYCYLKGHQPTIIGDDFYFIEHINLKCMWSGAGMSSTRLIFEQDSGEIDGIRFQAQKYGAVQGIRDVTLCCKGGDGGVAIRTSNSEYFNLRPKSIVENVEVQDFDGPNKNRIGFLTTFAWKEGFHFGDMQGLYAENLYYYGSYNVELNDSQNVDTTAFVLESSETLLFPQMGAIWANAPRIGVDVRSKCFFFIDAIDVTFSWIGFQALGNENYSEVFINRLAINAQKYGVWVENVVRFNLQQGFVNSRNNGLDQGQEWTGYFFDGLTKGFIGSIHAQPNKTLGGTTAFELKDCGGMHVNELTASANIQNGLVVDGTAGFDVSLQWQSAEVGGVPYSLKNNARQGNATIVVSPSFSGDVFVDDGTIDYRNHIINTPGANRRSSTNEFAVMDRFDIEDKDSLNESDKAIRLLNENGNFRLGLLDSVTGSFSNAILMNRTGNSVDLIDFRTSALKLNNGPTWTSSAQSPEGAVTATPGSFHSNTAGGSGESFYIKESGSGNTGWVAK